MPPVDEGKVLLEDAILALLAAQQPQPTAQASFITNGLGYSNIGLLIYRVSAGTVSINGVSNSFAQTDVTLDAADGTNPRIDLIVADSGTGTIHKITGTPAANPVRPDLDPLTQFQITFALVPANATTVPTIVRTLLYDEDTETTTSVSGARIVKNSTNNPLSGTKDVEGTACVADDWFKMVSTNPISVSAAKQLVLNIRSKASWPNAKNLQLTWFNGATKVGQVVAVASGSFGFNSATLGTYQQVVIPMNNPLTNFQILANANADTLEIRVKGGASAIGFYLDLIYLESEDVITAPTSDIDVVSLYFTGKVI